MGRAGGDGSTTVDAVGGGGAAAADGGAAGGGAAGADSTGAGAGCSPQIAAERSLRFESPQAAAPPIVTRTIPVQTRLLRRRRARMISDMRSGVWLAASMFGGIEIAADDTLDEGPFGTPTMMSLWSSSVRLRLPRPGPVWPHFPCCAVPLPVA